MPLAQRRAMTSRHLFVLALAVVLADCASPADPGHDSGVADASSKGGAGGTGWNDSVSQAAACQAPPSDLVGGAIACSPVIYHADFGQTLTRAGTYTATVTVDQRRYDCTAVLPVAETNLPSCTPAPPIENLPDVSWTLSAGTSQNPGLGGFDLWRTPGNAFPTTVAIAVSYQGAPIGNATLQPVYGCWVVGFSLWCWNPRGEGHLTVSLPP
jgi:hypothetical protein